MNFEHPGEVNGLETTNKIEENRQRGRIRSKISRERRKAYVKELEDKIKELQKENFRLQNLLVRYQNDKEKINPVMKTFADMFSDGKSEILEKLEELEK